MFNNFTKMSKTCFVIVDVQNVQRGKLSEFLLKQLHHHIFES